MTENHTSNRQSNGGMHLNLQLDDVAFGTLSSCNSPNLPQDVVIVAAPWKIMITLMHQDNPTTKVGSPCKYTLVALLLVLHKLNLARVGM